MTSVELRAERMVAGGAALARDSDGRVVFVVGALPGEVVRAEVVEERKDFRRAIALDIVDASPLRVGEPCPSRARGCGGCDWQHVAPTAQLGLKADVLADALRRLGRVTEPHVVVGGSVPSNAYRTTVRAALDAYGRAGFRAHSSHEVVAAQECLVAHPTIASGLRRLRAPGGREVTVRTSVATGAVNALVDPVEVQLEGWDDALVGPDTALDEIVAGTTLRVSLRSFFQSGPAAAEILVGTVRAALGDVSGAVAIDAYGGVGLFAATVLRAAEAIELVESSRSSVDDARHNLRHHRAATVVRSSIERWRPRPADVVVADPPRTGLGARAAQRLAETGAARFVLVSCDPAALGRDTRLLADLDYELRDVIAVDLFPHTHHVEAVASFTVGAGRRGARAPLASRGR